MTEETLYERVKALNLLNQPDTELSDPSTEVTENSTVLPLSNSHSWRAQPRNDLRCGEAYRGRRILFCPWNIVTHYHEWFVGKKNGELIRPYFDPKALLRCKLWDFYYVWHPASAKKDQYAIVVPTDQFEDLISRINETLDIQLAIPAGVHSGKFRVMFGELSTPLPRFLGHALDPASFSSMISGMPPIDPRDAIYDMPRISPHARTAYLKKVDRLFESYDKARRKRQKSEKNHQKNLYQRRSWGRQAKRVQRYLGLRGNVDEKLGHPRASDVPKGLDLNSPTSFLRDKDVTFVAIDIESYEFNSRMVTEIGFGILNTDELANVAPGEGCKKWHSLIHGRHIRIQEHAHAVNRIHVQGYENNFNFGTSEFVKLNDVPQLLKDILQPVSPNGEFKRVVLVGHGISSDLNFVKNVGFDIGRDARLLEIVDTQHMHRHLRMLPQEVGLGKLLIDLDVDHSFLHNGGNDAVYTMQAMISLAVLQREASLRRHHERLQPSFVPDSSIKEGGWDTGGEMSDGGLPEADMDWTDEAPAPDTAPDTGPDAGLDTALNKLESKRREHKKTRPIAKISDEEANERWGTQEPIVWPLLPPQQADLSSEAAEEDNLIWL